MISLRPWTPAENAPAEPGDSYTRDAQVSQLLNPGPATPEAPRAAVVLLRGALRSKQELDGTVVGDDAAKTGETKAAEPKAGLRTTTFTRTNPSVPQ